MVELVYTRDLKSLALWARGFESRPRHTVGSCRTLIWHRKNSVETLFFDAWSQCHVGSIFTQPTNRNKYVSCATGSPPATQKNSRTGESFSVWTAYFLRRSRISVSNTSSALFFGGSAGASASFFWSLLICFMTTKIASAMIIKLISVLIKSP